MEATNRINDLIDITSHLVDLLARENHALREKRPDEVTALMEEKNNLTRAYETRVDGLSELVENPEELDEVDSDLQERLHGLGDKVSKLVGENARLLKVAIDANKRVVEAIADAVKSTRPGPGTYSAKGAVGDDGPNGSSQNVSFTLDRSL